MNFGILIALIVQVGISKADRFLGAITGYVITTGILIWGIHVYSNPYQHIAIFGIELSKGVFIGVCVVWYIFDTFELIRATSREKGDQADKNPSIPYAEKNMQVEVKKASVNTNTTKNTANRAHSVKQKVQIPIKIECPNCETVYQVNNSRIPNGGAYCRCIKCQKKLFVMNRVDRKRKSTTLERMLCPNCQHERNGKDTECPKCGVVYDKYFGGSTIEKNELKTVNRLSVPDTLKVGKSGSNLVGQIHLIRKALWSVFFLICLGGFYFQFIVAPNMAKEKKSYNNVFQESMERTAKENKGYEDRKKRLLANAKRNWPKYSEKLRGHNSILRIINSNDFDVRVGLRSGEKGMDFVARARSTRKKNIPEGYYDIFFMYSKVPYDIYQGDSFSTDANERVSITLEKVERGNYGIRKVY